MSRILFVVQSRTPRIIPFPEPGDDVKREWLVEKLREYHDISGVFVNSPDGDSWYREWYTKIAQERLAIEDPKLSGYFERKPDHLIRLAMILSVSRKAGEFRLTGELYEQALKILDTLEIPMPEAFVSVGETPMGTNARRVLKQLAAAGGRLDHSTLLQKNYRYMDKVQFARCVETLQEAGLIDRGKLGKKTIYLLTAPGENLDE